MQYAKKKEQSKDLHDDIRESCDVVHELSSVWSLCLGQGLSVFKECFF